MELDLSLVMCPNMIVKIFGCIAIMVVSAILAKATIAISKYSKQKDKKEVESNDNRGNKKRSS